MILSHLNYSQHHGQDNYWEIKDVTFGRHNLIVGLNATGKTRLLNVISGLAKILSKRIANLLDGNWDIQFTDEKNNDIYDYKLIILNKLIILEEMYKNASLILKREGSEGQLFSHIHDKMIDFAPPVTELTLYVRRDIKEFPFLEKLLDWANNFHGYCFTEISPSQIIIPSDPSALMENLGSTPYLLAEALKKEGVEDTIINEFSSIGYPIEKVAVESERLPGVPGDVMLSSVKEEALECFTKQLSMSQGMYRALSFIVIIQYLLSLNEENTVAIDDIGEGLDFDRSTKITQLIFNKLRNSNIQLIATSNNRFLINAVDIELLNLLERKGHVVQSYNYKNSKEQFDAFKITGLSNFDFFSGQMYKDRNKS